ncbi:MAG: PhzF family phenazine biosynthesis protein [Bacteroidales bacterium]
MKNIIYHVDAFIHMAISGNPAGVMICDKLPAVEMMQNIAMEMNLSETAFVEPAGDHYIIRFYAEAGYPSAAMRRTSITYSL